MGTLFPSALAGADADELIMRFGQFMIPLAVFGGVVTATVMLGWTGHSVASGSSAVTSCNSSAKVSPHAGYAQKIAGYELTSVSLGAASGCAGMSFRLSLLDVNGRKLAERTGHLGRQGSAEPSFAALNIPAADVGSIAVTITGDDRTYYR